MSRRRRWAVTIVLGLLALPLVLTIVAVAIQAAMGEETHRFGGHYAVRYRGSLVVWRYHTQWINIDFADWAEVALGLGFWAGVGLLVFCFVYDGFKSRGKTAPGFEVVMKPPEFGAAASLPEHGLKGGRGAGASSERAQSEVAGGGS